MLTKTQKQSLRTPHLSSLYTTCTTHSKNGAANTTGLNACNSIFRANLMLHPVIWNRRFFAVSLCGNISPFGTYNATYLPKCYKGTRPLTSFCFGFACAHAQGTQRRKRRQVPCPLLKMIGRNRLQGPNVHLIKHNT